MKVERAAWSEVDGWSGVAGIDSPNTLVVAFADRSVESDARPIEQLGTAFPSSVVVGCSTAGQIAGDRLVDGVCVAAAAKFDQVTLRAVDTRVDDSLDSTVAGHDLARQLSSEDLRAVLVLSEGLRVNGSELVAGLRGGLPPNVVIVGGLAGDGDRFERTWVLSRGERRHDAVVAVGFYGAALRVSTGSAGGWGIFGPERVITRSERNVLYELDGQPALALYSRYLGELAANLPASALLFPLAIRSPDGGQELVRTILAVDHEAQTLTFAGDVPEGWTAQLTRSGHERLVDGAESAGCEAAGWEVAVTDGPDGGTGNSSRSTLAIAVSCVGRRLVLGERTEEELEATLDALGPDAEMVGFYSYGEIAPGCDGKPDLHNQTMTVTTFLEAVRG